MTYQKIFECRRCKKFMRDADSLFCQRFGKFRLLQTFLNYFHGKRKVDLNVFFLLVVLIPQQSASPLRRRIHHFAIVWKIDLLQIFLNYFHGKRKEGLKFECVLFASCATPLVICFSFATKKYR